MQTKSIFSTRQMPRYPVRFALGLLVLLLTLLLVTTAVFSADLFTDEPCNPAASPTFADFSADTAVPNCWLVQ